VKSVSLPALIARCQIVTEIENLFNLRHPLIAPLIGFVFPVESDGRREWKTARLHASGGSLADIFLNPPAWWTPTAKAKAVVGIALALRFAHGVGLLHGAVEADNVLFDADRRIQLADFSAIRLERGEVEPFSGEKWSPAADVSAFASILSEIAVDRTAVPPIGAAGARPTPARVPAFVSQMIAEGRSPESQHRLLFVDIVEHLKQNCFNSVGGVDSERSFGVCRSGRIGRAVRQLGINAAIANPPIPDSI
jgi:serine/threonine protein kinase